ncbi:MAG TPA: orotate phosphoribosyltransferase [Egibacteraceae bacterium]|nr:orotate phosphoribosyltransferase [Egibacteraceae bacterium]
MNETEVASLFERLDVLRRGHFRLSSGKHSDTYLQCALALSDPQVALSLGAALADRIDSEVDVVVSPALGGVLAGFAVAAALGRPFLFAERDSERHMTMRRGQQLQPGSRVLVVEDVVTTGGSAMEVVALCEAAGATVVGLASLVDRSAGLDADQRSPLQPTSLLTVTAQAWDPPECPECAAGRPLDTPGSRHAA